MFRVRGGALRLCSPPEREINSSIINAFKNYEPTVHGNLYTFFFKKIVSHIIERLSGLYSLSKSNSNSPSSSSSISCAPIVKELAAIPRDSRIFAVISALIEGFSFRYCFAFSLP